MVWKGGAQPAAPGVLRGGARGGPKHPSGRVSTRNSGAPGTICVGSSLPIEPGTQEKIFICLLFRVDWALLPLSTSRSELVLLAGNCLSHHQQEFLATNNLKKAGWLPRFLDALC